MDKRRNDIVEVAKKVAQLLAENQVIYSDVNRIFNEAMNHLTVQVVVRKEVKAKC